ncbi:hypothetical protein L0156_23410 [bacterium]|nr:hypothetical protein [bacterium]
MKRLLLLFSICVLGVVWAQQISFNAAPPKVGQTFVRTSSYKMDVDVILKFAGESLQEHNDVSTVTVRKAETILETNRDAITKLKVTYELIDRKSVITEDDIPENKKGEPSPVLGRTYVVSVQNGAVKVTDVHGLKPSNDEIDIVESDYKNLGEADSFLQVFKNKSIQPGERVQMPGIVAEGIFTDSEHRQVKVDNATFVLKNVRQNAAIFDTALKMQWNQDANTSVKMNVAGETHVSIQSSRMLSSTLSGTVRVTGAEQLYNRLVMVDGKGKITITETLQIK